MSREEKHQQKYQLEYEKYRFYKQQYLQAITQTGGKVCDTTDKDKCVSRDKCSWHPEYENGGWFSKGNIKKDKNDKEIGSCQLKNCGELKTKTQCLEPKKEDNPDKNKCTWRPVLREKMIKGGLSIHGVPLHSNYKEVKGMGFCEKRRELCNIL